MPSRFGSALAGIGRLLAGDIPDPNAVKRDPFDPRWWGSGGQMAVSGVAVTSNNVLQLGSVQTVLNGGGGSVATLPWMVFERGPDDSRKPLPQHPLSQLLGARPNANQPAGEFLSEATQHLLFWRNFYCRIWPGDDYAIGELEILHPRRLQKIERRNGRVFYTFSRLPPDSGVDVFRDDEIWHTRLAPLTVDGLRGQAVYETAREVFGRALAVRTYGDIWFRNSGQTGGIIEHPGNFKDKDAREEFIDFWRAQSTGPNRHRDRILLNGLKYAPLKVTNAEAQLLETENACDQEIFGLWNYPQARAGRLGSIKFTNIEQQSIDYVVHFITPLVVALEQSAKHSLLLDPNPEKYLAEFNVGGLLRGDIISRYGAYQKGRQWGWLSANDIRKFENMNPIDGGNIYMTPLNMSPAGAPTDDETNPANPDRVPGDDEQPQPPLAPNPDDDD